MYLSRGIITRELKFKYNSFIFPHPLHLVETQYSIQQLFRFLDLLLIIEESSLHNFIRENFDKIELGLKITAVLIIVLDPN